MTEEVVYRKIFRCTNKDQIRYLGRYVYKIKNNFFNRTKVNLNITTIYNDDGLPL